MTKNTTVKRDDQGWYMLEMSGGPYGAEMRYYRNAMHKDAARRTASDFRKRIGCSVRVIAYTEEV